MFLNNFWYLLFFIGMLSCSSIKTKKEITAQQVIDNSIKAHGFYNLENSTINFNFRDKKYVASRRKNKFSYSREYRDTQQNLILDELNNNGFSRKINDSLIVVSNKKSTAYSSSINSVMYFAFMPYNLNDEAVNKELLASVTINNTDYYAVKISFSQKKGGEDFQDQFIYWFNQENFLLDYFAYSYVTSGGGIRFREVAKRDTVNNLLFNDYNNYEYSNLKVDLSMLPKLFETHKLKLLSKIELKNIVVR